MPNSLFNQLGGGQTPGPLGQIQQFMSEFQQFKNSFKGNPQQEVQRLLNSGQLTQQQYNQLQQAAIQIARMMGG